MVRALNESRASRGAEGKQKLYFVALGAMKIGNERYHCIPVKGVLQQTLLAALLASDGRLLSADDLIQELWGTTPPSRTDNALHAQISRLRRAIARLEPERDEFRITRTSSGYQLSLDDAEFDAAILRDTVHSFQGRGGTYTREDADMLRAAIDLWQGPVFGGIAGGPICQNSAVRYQEYLTSARNALYRAEICLGESSKTVPELSALVEEFPFQESFYGLLMAALYRSGRQADALATGRKLRSRLTTELGVEPGPLLRLLEKAILNHDQRLIEETVVHCP